MATLVDLYRGRVGGQDFPTFIDPAQESAWTERAIAAGDLVVIYNRAWQLGQAFEQNPEPALQQQSRALYRRCVDEAAPHDRVWRPAHKNLAVLLYQGEDDADKQEAVFDLLGPLWWRGDSATQAWAAGFLADVFHFGNGVPANAFLAKVWLERAAEAEPDNADVLRMRPLIDGQGKLFGASRATRQQARDRDKVDLRSWQLTFGQHAVPDRHDIQPV
jgi:TPR repeat protein